MVPEGSSAEYARLILMATKLYRFMTILAVPAVGLGLWLWLYYGIGKHGENVWLYAKLFLVVLALGYHHSCGRLLKKFNHSIGEASKQHGHVWYRWYNEVPVLLLLAIVILVVLKPI